MKRVFIVFAWIFAIFVLLYLPNLHLFPTKERSINIFIWGETLMPQILKDFERETGIRIHLSYFSSNEELLVKMQATEGRGYDLIMPSDYAVSVLTKQDLLKPLDKKRLKFFSQLNPSLTGLSYDPQNTYSIPFEWEIHALGYSPAYIAKMGTPPLSWGAIFDKRQIDYTVGMNNDPIEAIQFAALYLFGKTEDLSREQFEQIRSLLIEQNRWVEAYTNARPDYFLATGNCPVVVTYSSLIKRLKQIYPEAGFAIPKEGAFISIENFCIPKNSTNYDLVYDLLNYLYRDPSLIAHYKTYGFFPATHSTLSQIDFTDSERDILRFVDEDFDKLHFFQGLFPRKEVIDLWVQVKSF